ncbi:MAG: selenium-dependent molybdenum cofactor biosynthesis protein YqeB [Sphaerochaetaceae bacterium]|nr:selenium-dependent molybdenum cofactor biosynthesis protein YqeB [Sphaerochaetaceae bacterium]
MNIFKKAGELEEQNIAFALITITKSVGSTPRSSARMIVLADGTTYGTVGGGVAEYEVVKKAVGNIPLKKSEFFSKSLKVTEGHNCGGDVEFYIEVVNSAPRLILIGGGHVNLEIARLAISCGFFVEIVETREAFANAERFPFAHTFYVDESIEKALGECTIDKECAVVIATHSLDRIALEKVIGSPAWYIGMLGSRTKVRTFRNQIREKMGIDIAAMKNLFAPIGLDINAKTPSEIAVSVVSEIMSTLHHTSGKSLRDKASNLVIVRGAGDLATGVIVRLHKAGYRVLALEIERPTTIRRTVAFSQAMYDRQIELENVVCTRCESVEEAKSLMDANHVAIMHDEVGESIKKLHPEVVVDAILAKKNLGTTIDCAPFVIGLGPGFTAQKDCHAVIETKRGHYLGSIIAEGEAAANTGIPGIIGGYGAERVIHSSVEGVFFSVCSIGDIVRKGDVIAHIGKTEVTATIDGVLRGMLHDGLPVPEGFKIADIDPRAEVSHCFSISDKAKAVGGAVLEAVDSYRDGKFFLYNR